MLMAAKQVEQQAKPASLVPDWMRPTLKTKLVYSIPYYAYFMLMAPMFIELQIFYTDTLLVPAGLLALIMAVARAWDALNDPVLGWMSDHTRTRWGRRIPYIAVGVPLTALTYWMMFSPPTGLSVFQVCIWLFVAYWFYYLFNTIWHIPYEGLGFELSPDYHDRTSMYGYRTFFGQFGIICGFALLFYFKFKGSFGGDERQLLFVVTGGMAILFVLLFTLPVFMIKENPIFLQFKRSPIVPGVRRALRNKPFRIILWVMILGSVPTQMPILVMPYFVKYVLASSSMIRLFYALIFVTSALVAIPIWTRISKRFGKVHVWMVSITFGVVGCFSMFFVGEGQIYFMGAMELVRGFGSSAIAVLIPAMIADIIDYDEFKTGRRREAQFGAFLGLLPKFVAILSGALPLAVLGIVGYDPALSTVSSATHFTIRILYSILPFSFHAVCMVILFFYPLSAKVHEAIREGVELHKKGQDAKDPLTGEIKKPVNAQAVPEDTGWFLDFFSIRELKGIVAKGVSGIVGKVYVSVILTSAFILACFIGVYFLIVGAMTISQADQARQAIASALVFSGGLGIAVLVYHIMRIKQAKKITANPVAKEMIQNHIDLI